MFANGFRDVLGKPVSDKSVFEKSIEDMLPFGIEELWIKIYEEVAEKFKACKSEFCKQKIPKHGLNVNNTPCTECT